MQNKEELQKVLGDVREELRKVLATDRNEAPCEPKISRFEQLADEIGKLVAEKNEAYGDAFAKAGEFLKLLYPKGLRADQYSDALALCRIFDKMMRIATRKSAFGESPYRDIAGYGLLGIVKDELTAATKYARPMPDVAVDGTPLVDRRADFGPYETRLHSDTGCCKAADVSPADKK
jgi:hypothetical protein